MRHLHLCLSALTIAACTAAQSVTIDFELGGPTVFLNANPLREEYAGLGVHFSGPGPLDGGAVLNDSSWLPAVSGTDILGFNANSTMANGGTPVGPERIDFDFAIESISVWYSGSGGTSTGDLRAFDAANNQIGFDTVNVNSSWGFLEISGVGDIAYISINSGNDPTWLLDDLTFEPVPEPGTLLAIGIGLAGLAIARRRR